MSLQGRLSVAATSLLLGTVYVSLWWTLVDEVVIACIVAFVILHLPLLLFCWTFIKAIKSEPGFVPFNWLPAIGNGQSDSIARQTREKEEPEDGEEKRERDVEERLRQQQPQVLRYCRCCSSFKPPRSHHCNICKRMEHHSFWINNCIGHYNQKYYLLFLFYGTVSGIGAALLFTWVIINVFFEDIKEGQVDNVAKYALKKNVIGINLAIVVPATFAFLAMLLLQGSHLLQNTTTLEVCEKRRAEHDAFKEHRLYRYPYNLGCYRNVEQGMGRNPWLWLWPGVSGIDSSNSGLHFVPNEHEFDWSFEVS